MSFDAQTEDFKDWFVAQADSCRETISKHANALYKNWIEQGLGENTHPHLLRAKAKHVTTESAIKIWVARMRHGKSTPPPSDTTSISETLKKMAAPQCSKEVIISSEDDEEPMKKRKKEDLEVIVVKRKKEETEPERMTIPAEREPKKPCNCKSECAVKITQAERSEICQKYWQTRSCQREEVFKQIGEIIEHQSIDNHRSSRSGVCGVAKKKTYFFYKAKAKIQICQNFFIATLGCSRSTFPDLKTVPCAECANVKSSYLLKTLKK